MRNKNDWPYNGSDGMIENYSLQNGRWTECNEDHYENQLECVPPLRQNHSSFMVGEEYGWKEENGNSYSTYACFVQVKGRYFGKIIGEKDYNPDILQKEIFIQYFGLTQYEPKFKPEDEGLDTENMYDEKIDGIIFGPGVHYTGEYYREMGNVKYLIASDNDQDETITFPMIEEE